MLHFINGRFPVEDFIPFMIFSIPIIAIIGGITSGIVKTLTEAKMIENAQRERLAALQAGIDIEKLPPLPTLGRSSGEMLAGFNPAAAQKHRAQGLLIGGLITLFAGIGIAAFLNFMVDGADGDRAWAVGIIPALIGVALLLSSIIVWPRGSRS